MIEVKKMQPQIPDEAWPYMDRYLQSIPQNLWKLPTFDQALEKSQQRGQQRAIIRQLRRKFKQIPNSVVQKIEATDDQEQLDQWLDLVIEANSLTEMGLSEPHN
jgi:predicted ATP-dependent Lon-type protease